MGNGKRGLAISGGGALGAYAGGVIQYLIEDQDNDYDIVVGTSTGALMSPLVALNEMDLLKKAYTNVTNEKIYSLNPFNIKNGKVKGLKKWNAIWRIVRGKKSLGETKNLRSEIEKFFTPALFNRLQSSGKQVIVAVTNLNEQQAEYKANYENSYQDFVDWMWASTCVPVVMLPFGKDGADYVDGGVVGHNPIQLLFEKNCSTIDAIMPRPENVAFKHTKDTNILKVITNTIGTMIHEINQNDINIAELTARKNDVAINFYHTPKGLNNNALIFNKPKMRSWWKEGYNNAQRGENKVRRFLSTEFK